VEPEQWQSLALAIEQRRLTPKTPGRWLLTETSPSALGLENRPELRAAILAQDQGACVFHNAGDAGCRIHHALGHAALPLECRQFPRQSVRHPAGVSVTLSHYCPTASELLTTSGGFDIVENAPGFPLDAEYVGLTADPSLPPLIHPQLAMDWESWWEVERLSVGLLNDAPDPLPRLRLAIEHIRTWSIGDGPLLTRVRETFAQARRAAVVPFAPGASVIDAWCEAAVAAVPPQWQPIAAEALSAPAGDGVTDQAWRRFVAAHAFANWTVYLGEGLCSWYRSIEAAACLLARTGDPGRADLVLRHLADPHTLAARYSSPMKGYL
jgi:hypothetical protein